MMVLTISRTILKTCIVTLVVFEIFNKNWCLNQYDVFQVNILLTKKVEIKY